MTADQLPPGVLCMPTSAAWLILTGMLAGLAGILWLAAVLVRRQ
jgi:hypothetical protein